MLLLRDSRLRRQHLRALDRRRTAGLDRGQTVFETRLGPRQERRHLVALLKHHALLGVEVLRKGADRLALVRDAPQLSLRVLEQLRLVAELGLRGVAFGLPRRLARLLVR